MKYIRTPIIRKEAEIVRKNIKSYGGSFMRAIGNAIDYADTENLKKIKAAWSDEWKRYLEMEK